MMFTGFAGCPICWNQIGGCQNCRPAKHRSISELQDELISDLLFKNWNAGESISIKIPGDESPPTPTTGFKTMSDAQKEIIEKLSKANDLINKYRGESFHLIATEEMDHLSAVQTAIIKAARALKDIYRII